MIGSSRESRVTGAMICAPSTGWAFMIIRSSRLSRSCLSRTLSGTPILPTSWSRPPHSRASSSESVRCIARPMSPPISLTRQECLLVYGSRLSTAPASAVMVWVNISRISMKLWYASRVVYSGRANSRLAHHANVYICAISQASGARAIRHAAKLRGSVSRSCRNWLPGANGEQHRRRPVG